jgi:uncharacterized protein YdaU (DUF1376 family)
MGPYLMRHFAHNIGDYAAATAHLSFVEDAAYHRCLRRYYQDERPLPEDVATVCRLVGARTKEERTAVGNVLEEFFTLEDGGWHQRRADKEIEVYHAKADAARENGTKGGRPPNRRKTNPVSPSVQSKKLTTPHSPSSEAKASDADAASVVFNQGLAWLMKSTGKAEDNCRSQLGKWRKEIGDEALIVVLGRGQREAPIDAMGWLEKAVAASVKGPQRKPWEKPDPQALPPTEPWEQRMQGWNEKRQWVPQVWGPRPGEPGCRAPKHLIGTGGTA